MGLPSGSLLLSAALMAALLAICGPTAASAKEQVQVIFALQGPCFAMADAQVEEVINKVANALTGVPWGNQQQSGGFASLCTKAGLDCGVASSRKLLQTTSDAASCTNKYLYLYLDTTQSNSGWTTNGIITKVKGIVNGGQFQAALASTSVKANSVILRYIGNTTLPDPSPSPSPTPSGTSPTPSSYGSGSAGGSITGGGSSGSGSSSSAGSRSRSRGFWSKTGIIAVAVGAVTVMAVIAALVAALIYRKKAWVDAKIKVTEDLEAFRVQKRGNRIGTRVESTMGSTMSRSIARGMARASAASAASATSQASAATFPLSSPSVTAPAGDIDVGSLAELDSVLDANQMRSAQPEVGPQEKKSRGFLGLFGGRA